MLTGVTTNKNPEPVDVTVTLSDDMRQRAKKEKLNLSQMLREAVAAEFEKRDAMTRLTSEPQTYEVALQDHNGREYTGRIQGKLIHDAGGQALYATAKGRFIFVDGRSYEDHGSDVGEVAEFLTDWLEGQDDDEILDAFEALGVKAVIEL
jgi:post-segregation antitoxin (ccd killing protein)